ncbi:MAG: hypothetical protein KJ675_17230 [Gammaproteobacteria bacterium]|nr:hypothetical protein [Gammaproteobacteria bacterium]
MRNSLVIAAGMLLSVASMASEYTSAKPLLRQAIDAPDGRSNGILVGAVAEKFVSTTGSSAPVRVEVTTIKSFKQEGCRRLNLRMSQADVATKDGRKVVFAMDYGINLCRDGSAPVEGANLSSSRSELQ